jgi:hypothetical protein
MSSTTPLRPNLPPTPPPWYTRPDFWVHWGLQLTAVGAQGVAAAATNDPKALMATAIIGSVVQLASTLWQANRR